MCYYRIVNPIVTVVNVADARNSTHQLAATSLRNILGMKTLQEILQEKEIIAHKMQEMLDDATETW